MEAHARTVSPLEKALYLKSLPALKDLSNEGLSLVAQTVVERRFSKGDRLQEPGRPPGSAHLVVEGRVRATGGEYGNGETVETGQPVGMLSMLARAEEGLEAVAENDVVTLELAYDEIVDLFEDHFELLTNQIRNLAQRLLLVRKRIPDGSYLAPAEGEIDRVRRRFDLVDRLVFMTQGGVFESSNVEALIELARGVEEVEFPQGRVLWRKGDPSGFMYNVASGTVRCEVDSDRAFRAGPGYPVGNLESQAGEPRWYTATTETPVRALLARTDTFIDILEDHFETAIQFVAAMARGTLNVLEQERSGVSLGTQKAVEDVQPTTTESWAAGPRLRPFLPAGESTDASEASGRTQKP